MTRVCDLPRMLDSAPPLELTPGYSTQMQSTRWAVTFWGVRGHLPTPGLTTAQYGGNTACLEVYIGNQRLIFDGGTGLKVLGDALSGQVSNSNGHTDALPAAAVSAHLLFTHSRWDRIQGVPFFSPAFDDQNEFNIYGASAANGASIKQCLSTQMLQPNCPIPFHTMRAKLSFHNISGGQILDLGSVRLSTLVTHSQTGAMGYRICHEGYTIVYATEVSYATMSAALARWARQADLLICDGGSMPQMSGVKPSTPTWQAAVNVAKRAEARRTILTAFDPDQTDHQLSQIAQQLKAAVPMVSLAQEGLQIEL